MIAVDTSIVIASFATWHEGHVAARGVVAAGVALPAHCLVESYSVLTRLPPPHRVGGSIARDFLRARFPHALSTPAEGQLAALLDRLADTGVTGGATYDGLIGLTAAHHRARLVSLDRRAADVYARLGVDFELVA